MNRLALDPLNVKFPFNAVPTIRTSEMYDALVQAGLTKQQASAELVHRHRSYVTKRRDMAQYDIKGIPIWAIAQTEGGARYLHWFATESNISSYGPLHKAIEYLFSTTEYVSRIRVGGIETQAIIDRKAVCLWFHEILERSYSSMDDRVHTTPKEDTRTPETRIPIYDSGPSSTRVYPINVGKRVIPNEEPDMQDRITIREPFRREDHPEYNPQPRRNISNEAQAWMHGIDLIEALGKVAGVSYDPSNAEHRDPQEELQEICDTIKLYLTDHGKTWLPVVPQRVRDAITEEVANAKERIELVTPERDKQTINDTLIIDAIVENPRLSRWLSSPVSTLELLARNSRKRCIRKHTCHKRVESLYDVA